MPDMQKKLFIIENISNFVGKNENLNMVVNMNLWQEFRDSH